MTTFEEILTTAKNGNGGMDQQPTQTDQIFLLSLVKCLASCPQEQWDELSQDARDWYNASVRATNGMIDLPLPEGFKDESLRLGINRNEVVGNVVGIDVAGPGEAETKPPILPAVKSVSQLAAQQTKVVNEKKQKNQGILNGIRRAVILHPDWTTRQIHQHLTENGFPNTKLDIVSVNAGDIRRTIAIVKELGHWQEINEKVQA